MSSEINKLYKTKGRMPSFYKVRSFFDLDSWYELNPTKIFNQFKKIVPKKKYNKDIEALKLILKLIDKEVLLISCKENNDNCYGEYDNERKAITIYCEEEKFCDFATIFFHEIVHLMQYKKNENLSDTAISLKFDGVLSKSWLIERTADIASKRIMKYVYKNIKPSNNILNGYTRVCQVKELYEYMDSYWIEEHNTKEGFFVDDLNVTQL